MVRVEPVDDPLDARLADYVDLRDADLRRRTGSGVVIVEGVTAIQQLLATDLGVRSLLLTPTRLEQLTPDLESRDLTIYVAPRDLLRQVVGFDLHRGAVASADRPSPPVVDDLLRRASTVAVLEGLNDHENLGAVGRSAAALGIDALLLDPTCADPFYRRSVRVSMGHLLHLPVARVDDWPAGLSDVRAAGFRLIALTPSADATPLDEVRRSPDEGVALLLGAEGPGLSPTVLALADERVRIPVAPNVDSLNVGHAAAIAFHHFGRVARG